MVRLKFGTMMAATLATVLCAGAVQAADATAKPKVVEGTITKVEGANVTVKHRDHAVVIVTNADTKVRIADQDKAVSDLVVGQQVRVVLNADGSAAASIMVRKPRTR